MRCGHALSIFFPATSMHAQGTGFHLSQATPLMLSWDALRRRTASSANLAPRKGSGVSPVLHAYLSDNRRNSLPACKPAPSAAGERRRLGYEAAHGWQPGGRGGSRSTGRRGYLCRVGGFIKHARARQRAGEANARTSSMASCLG